MSLENDLWLSGVAIETVVVCLLIFRRVWRLFPIFSAYCVWDVFSNVATVSVQHYSLWNYRTVYLIDTVIDSFLVFAVLAELGWSVLRPIRSQLPRATPVAIGMLVLLVGAAIWPFSGIPSLSSQAPMIRGIMHVQQTTSILRVLFFLTLAACSQFLSIGWRDRELQVATGLGFYSLISLGAAIIHTHETTIDQYDHLNQFVVTGYICSLAYWVYSFAQQEAERREFTPQMQNLLLAAAGVAREQRLALVQASMERHRQNS